MTRCLVFLLLIAPAVSLAKSADAATEHANDKPIWELGAGIGAISIPDYRGSKESHVYAIPIPYIRYHGKFIQTDDGKVRGVFPRTENIELEVSIGGAFTPKSKDNKLRRGMPELGSAIEFGPALNINLSGDDFSQGWLFQIPARSTYAIDSNGIRHTGWVWNPGFIYKSNAPKGRWDINFSLKALYGNKDYHDYYYSVKPVFATNTRPAYQASRGYSGYSSALSIGRRTGKIWYGAFAVYNNLDSATFANSPLVETKSSITAGFGISWIFAYSKQ